MPRQPIVAVTATTEIIRGLPRVRVNEAYTSAIAAAGMIPLVVAPLDPQMAAGIVERVDGIVLTRGEDIGPVRYGAPAHRATDPAHEARDAMEIALVEAAHTARLPVLAICRGLQLANVALGGTLIQDLPTERPSSTEHAPPDSRNARTHPVQVTPGSMLAAALGATSISVNSSHHQAIGKLAPGLTASAVAPDGVIEGAEWTDDDWWMLAVQWHPEELIQTAEPWDRALFAAFRATVSATAFAR